MEQTCIFTESVFAGCTDFSRYGWGFSFATSGQRIDPTTESDFVWRLPTPEGCGDYTSEMKYTNWGGIQPDYSKRDQACMMLGAGHSYHWNDYPCWYPICFLCELDIAKSTWVHKTACATYTPDISVRTLLVCFNCYQKRLLLLSCDTLVEVSDYALINYLLCNVCNQPLCSVYKLDI